MNIHLEKISKKYGSQWIFKNLDFNFVQGKKYALIGSNGAGKSTLIGILVGKIPHTKGKITYSKNNTNISVDIVYKEFSIATTSMSLIEEFTLAELVSFHFKFRSLIPEIEQSEIFELLGLKTEKNKLISNFSSGMKQRLKIGLAIFSQSTVLILDEPGANLDDKSKNWFKELLYKYLNNRLLIIASNDASDYSICNEILDISDFKS